MMPVIYKQTLAEQDLIDIWLYSWREWGQAQADTYLDDLEQALRLVVSVLNLTLSCVFIITRSIY